MATKKKKKGINDPNSVVRQSEFPRGYDPNSVVRESELTRNPDPSSVVRKSEFNNDHQRSNKRRY